jgi:uncharacterized LabA/DUF88 family protein
VPPRTCIYIDGFNLYYGAVKNTPYKWLDLQRYFRLLRPHDDLVGIRYFTAAVDGPSRANQETYWRALATLPLVEIVLGKFKTKRVECTHNLCTTVGRRFFEAREEKRTDVSIGVRMLDDAYQDVCDNLVLVSGDSDLVPPIVAVRNRFPDKRIFVYVPTNNLFRRHATELSAAAHRQRELPIQLLSRSQFPTQLIDALGPINKPPTW